MWKRRPCKQISNQNGRKNWKWMTNELKKKSVEPKKKKRKMATFKGKKQTENHMNANGLFKMKVTDTKPFYRSEGETFEYIMRQGKKKI